MKYVLEYILAADGFAKIPATIERHRAALRAYHEAGTLFMAGPIGNPPTGALAVFATREAAQQFAETDPFVLEGVVGSRSIREWQETLFSPSAATDRRP